MYQDALYNDGTGGLPSHIHIPCQKISTISAKLQKQNIVFTSDIQNVICFNTIMILGLKNLPEEVCVFLQE